MRAVFAYPLQALFCLALRRAECRRAALLTVLTGLMGALCWQPLAAHAQSQTAAPAVAASAPQPVEVQADSLQHNESKKRSVFRGNVVITRGPTRIECDELDMTRDARDNIVGQARGIKRDVQVTSRSPNGADIVAHAKTLDFNTATQTGVLRGQAFFQQTAPDGAVNTVSGEVVDFNWDNQSFQAVGSQGGRVRLKLVPGAGSVASVPR